MLNQGEFPQPRNFYLRTRVNEIETMYDRSRINVKVELLSTSTFTRDTSYIASILFTRVKFTAQAHKNYAAVEIHPKEHSYLIVLTALSHLSVALMK